jgi:hypothetical protein
MSLIAVLPVLGLAGLFDTRYDRNTANDAGLELTVEAPTVLRRELDRPFSIVVKDASPSGQPAELLVPRSFIDGQRSVQLVPDPDSVDARAYRFELKNGTNVAARVDIQFEPGQSGFHEGLVTAVSGTRRVSVPLRMMVLP